MKRILSLLSVFILASLMGCEKEIVSSSEKENDPEEVIPSPVDDEDDDDNDDNVDAIDILTVAEAQAAAVGSHITVTGYIVASTTKSMKNVDFTAPFAGNSAIVIADVPAYPQPADSLLFPVCLTGWKLGREMLNLEDNPDLWNHVVYLSGIREKYMGRAGLKELYQFQVME